MVSTIATCGAHWWGVTSTERGMSDCPQCGNMAKSQVTDDGTGGFFAQQMEIIKLHTTKAVPRTVKAMIIESMQTLATHCPHCHARLNESGLCPDTKCKGSRPRSV